MLPRKLLTGDFKLSFCQYLLVNLLATLRSLNCIKLTCQKITFTSAAKSTKWLKEQTNISFYLDSFFCGAPTDCIVFCRKNLISWSIKMSSIFDKILLKGIHENITNFFGKQFQIIFFWEISENFPRTFHEYFNFQ